MSSKYEDIRKRLDYGINEDGDVPIRTWDNMTEDISSGEHDISHSELGFLFAIIDSHDSQLQAEQEKYDRLVEAVTVWKDSEYPTQAQLEKLLDGGMDNHPVEPNKTIDTGDSEKPNDQ